MPLLRELPPRLADRGYRAHVVQAFGREEYVERSGVEYHFVRGWAGRLFGGPTRLPRAINQLPAWRAIRRIRSIRPDIIHLHGSNLYVNHLLASSAAAHGRLILQYHGGYPSPNRIARQVQRASFARTHRFLFTTHGHAQPFVEAGLIRHRHRVTEFMETSSDFSPIDRGAARKATRMRGNPVFLWVARLEPVKDPITVLQGFELIVRARPDARLYMYYQTASLLDDVRAFVASRSELRPRVHLRGPASFDQMEMIYNSADFLVQASHREFSGCAVLEAMACGVIPVVTDIPSFSAMTDGGRAGVLFPQGDAAALARGVMGISPDDIQPYSARVRKRFEVALSFDALAHRLDGIYKEILTEPHVPHPSK